MTEIVAVVVVAVFIVTSKVLMSFALEPDRPWLFFLLHSKNLQFLNKLPPSSYLFFKITLKGVEKKILALDLEGDRRSFWKRWPFGQAVKKGLIPYQGKVRRAGQNVGCCGGPFKVSTSTA